MGMLDIRMRGERLGNIGAVQRVQTDNGAAAAFAARAGLGRVVSGLGGDMTRIAIEADRRIQDNAADEYVAKFEKAMLDYQRGSVAEDGTRTPGAMEVPIEDTAKWMKDNAQFRDRLGFRLKRELKMSGPAMRLARDRLRHFNMGLDGQWADRAMRTDRAREIGNAQGRMELETFNMSQPGATEETTRAWHDAVEKYLDKAQVFGVEERAAVKRQQALKILDAGIANLVSQVREDESGENSQGGKLFDEWIKSFKDGEVDQLLPFWSYVDDGKGGKTNPLVDALGEADLTAFKKSAVDRMKAAKDSWERDMAAKRREEHDAAVRRSVEGELAIRDVPPEKWAESYERLGRDENLKRLDPARAMRYLDTARDIRAAEKKAAQKAAENASAAAEKARTRKIKATEEELSGLLCRLQILELDGTVPQDVSNEAQAEIWRRFRVESLRGGVSPGFMQSFGKRMSTRLSEQEASAMRRFYAAFGYTGETSGDGGVPQTAKKEMDGIDFYAPVEKDGTKVEDSSTEVKGRDLFDYGETLLRTLRSLGPEMNRMGVVDAEIARLKTQWLKGKLSENRDASVRHIMDIQREARVRRAAETIRAEEDGKEAGGEKD